MASLLDSLKKGFSTALEYTKKGAFALAKAINRNRGKVYAGSAAAMLVADCIAIPPSIMQIPGKIAISAVTSAVPAGFFYLASYLTERNMTAQQNQAVVEPHPVAQEPAQEPVQSVNVGAARASSRRGTHRN